MHIEKKKLILRGMKESDLDAVLSIEMASFHDPWKREHFEYELTGNQYSVPLVCEVDNKIAGYAVCWNLFEEFHLGNIAVSPEYRGKGIGSFLMEGLEKEAREKQSSHIILEVRVSNTPAIALYERHGFRNFFRRRKFYSDGEDAYIMIKSLKNGDEI